MVSKAKKHPGLPLALWDQGIRVGPPPKPNRPEHPYQGTIHFQGLLINVENLAGSTRRGTSPDGKPWSTRMRHHYGEIADTQGSDGDPIDAFVGPNPIAPTAYVIHQKQLYEHDQHVPPGTYDEDKVMLGFSSKYAAVRAYQKHYNKPTLNPGVTEITVNELRRRCEAGELNFGSALVKGDLDDFRAKVKREDEERRDYTERHGNPFSPEAPLTGPGSYAHYTLHVHPEDHPSIAAYEMGSHYKNALPHERAHLVPYMHQAGLVPMHEPGEHVEFDGIRHQTEHHLRPGDSAVVDHQDHGWKLPAHLRNPDHENTEPGYDKVVVKTTVHHPDKVQKSDQLPGGQGDHLRPSDVDEDQLAEGIKHEMEHTRDPKIAREIALDHLAEDPSYYTKLQRIEKGGRYEYRYTANRPAGPGWERAPGSRKGGWRRQRGMGQPRQAAVEEPTVQRTLSRDVVQPDVQMVQPEPAPQQVEAPEPEPAPKPKAKETPAKPKAKTEPEPEPKPKAKTEPEPEPKPKAEPEPAQFTEDVLGHLAWMLRGKRTNPDERQAVWVIAQGCCSEGDEPPPLNEVPPKQLTEPPEIPDQIRDNLSTLMGEAYEKYPDAQGMIDKLMPDLLGAEPIADEGDVLPFNPDHHDHEKETQDYDPQPGEHSVTATSGGWRHPGGGDPIVRAKVRKPTLDEDPTQEQPDSLGPTKVFEGSDAPAGSRLHSLENGHYHMSQLVDLWGEKKKSVTGVDMPRQHQDELLRELWAAPGGIKDLARKTINAFKLEYNDENLRDFEQAAAIGALRGLLRYQGEFPFVRHIQRYVELEHLGMARRLANMADVSKKDMRLMYQAVAAEIRASRIHGVGPEDLSDEQIAEEWDLTKKGHYVRGLKNYTDANGEEINQNDEQVPLHENWRPLGEDGLPRKGSKTWPSKITLVRNYRDIRRGRIIHDSFWMGEHPEALVEMDSPDIPDGDQKDELHHEFVDLLSTLPEDQRAAVWAHYVEGKRHVEVGEELGISRAAVSRMLNPKKGVVVPALKERGRAVLEDATRRGVEPPWILSGKNLHLFRIPKEAPTEEDGTPKRPEHLFGPSQNELLKQYGDKAHVRRIMDARFISEKAHERMKEVIRKMDAGTADEIDHVWASGVQQEAEDRRKAEQVRNLMASMREQAPHQPEWVGQHAPGYHPDPVGHVHEKMMTDEKDTQYNPDATPEDAAHSYVRRRREDYKTHRRSTAERHRQRRIEHFHDALGKTKDPKAKEVIKQAMREEMQEAGVSDEQAEGMAAEAKDRIRPATIEDAGTWQDLSDAVMAEPPSHVDPFEFAIASREGASGQEAAQALMSREPEPFKSRITGLLQPPGWEKLDLPEIGKGSTSISPVVNFKTGETTSYDVIWRAGDDESAWPGHVRTNAKTLDEAMSNLEDRRANMQWAQKMAKYIRAANKEGWSPAVPESQPWVFGRGEVEPTVQAQEEERGAGGREEDVQQPGSAKKSLPPPSYGGPRLVISL